ncbi:ras guanine nucleotide exchange factor domain-containing protein [Mycotypha africana]|uniref:ras guanine nucleotide exchange factor domain-containing protein n=1 Tax=Mycotypha africana TaxID=64632 RepID=UPI0023009AFE|nr:ras guanine nucleotide exchange factor domain-containing protein [Mycotypha africana]KAI8984399.1 ras guanine nucleotide exchange factor domain-containing protein [Mycotypha africana]
MIDDQVSNALNSAIAFEEKGQIKEAYFAFTVASEKAIQALNDIKFVHSSIVSSPKHYAQLLATMRTCLIHIENIIENHSPAALKTVSQQTTGDSKINRPPLPPKPSKMQKPVLPPKPSKTTSRPPSPTNHTPTTSNYSSSTVDKELQDNSTDTIVIKPRVYDSRPTSLPPIQQHSHLSSVQSPSPRPRTEFPNKTSNRNTASVRIIAEGEIDPDYLVPAQTSAGDSLVPSLSTMTDHVPLIPAPPLLTTHRMLQAKVDDLEEKIRDCRARKQSLTQGDNSHLETMTESALDQTIAQYLRVLAELKATLNGVRTIYMSAATVPSILQFGAHVIAYQVTLIEAAIFGAIPPQALLEHSTKTPHPRIVASTDFFNYITRCIEHSVLLPQEASARAQLIHYWIKVASRCLELNNYQTLKAIISALNTPPVQRLKRTWSYIPKKSSTKLETLNDLMSEANNYGHYREHMGMVNTTVVNGKSVQLIRDEHYSRPTVPFLGTIIHDITYLLAAFKSSPHAKTMKPEDEPRIHDVLNTMHRFQSGPRYTPTLPHAFLKSSQKHHFRPALSNALHRGASRIQRFSGGNIFGGGNNSNNDSSTSNTSSNVSVNSVGIDGDDDDNSNLEEQQKMATQYILMRSWVSQSTVDELSNLREPPQPKTYSNTSYYGSRSSSGAGGGHISSNMNRTSSVFSNASSNLRFSTGSMSMNTLSTSNGGDSSRPGSFDDIEDEQKRKPIHNGQQQPQQQQNGFFSNFRRSDVGAGARPVTIHEGMERSVSVSSGLSREDQENIHVATSHSTGKIGTNLSTQRPSVPPRPVPKPPVSNDADSVTHNNDFKVALAQKLARAAAERN